MMEFGACDILWMKPWTSRRMMTRLNGIAASVLALSLSAASTPTAYATVPRDDAQVWIEADATTRLTSDSSLTLIATSREGIAVPNPTLAGGGLSTGWHRDTWNVDAGFYWVQIRGASSGGITEIKLPFISAAYTTELWGVSFSDRTRIEELNGIPETPHRYRNRVTA